MLRRRKHSQEHPTDQAEAASSRRRFLAGAAGAAGLAGMAVAEVAGARPASATQGQPVIAGQVNTAVASTQLHVTSTSLETSALAGVSNAPLGYGVTGEGTGSDGTGVGGRANGQSGYGVWGRSDIGYGVVGQTVSGIDFAAEGTGRVYQRPGAGGAPTTGSYRRGEQLRDAAGDLYLCKAGGTPGTWVRAATAQPGYAAGVSHFLSKPIRVYDTRSGFTARVVDGPAIREYAPRDVQVGGFSYNGVDVPSNILAVLCNLTVVDAAGPGFLSAYPTGEEMPGTSNVNYATGATIANFAQVRTGLRSDGVPSIRLLIGGGSAHVLVDLVGFVA